MYRLCYIPRRVLQSTDPNRLVRPARRLAATTSSDRNPASTEESKSETKPIPSEAQDTRGENRFSNDEEAELAMLYDAVLKQVPLRGWTDQAISAAVSDLGWSPAASQMIPRGPIQVVEEFVRRCNTSLAKRLSHEDEKEAAAAGGADPVGRATFAVRERLEMMEPYHHNWANALALQLLPQNSRTALKSSALLMDEIAHYAGYRNPDFSWYTDRAVLGIIYGATELYWLTDKSTGRLETWRFLEKRMRDSHDLRSGLSSAYGNIMTLSDAARGTLGSIIRSSRSY